MNDQEWLTELLVTVWLAIFQNQLLEIYCGPQAVFLGSRALVRKCGEGIARASWVSECEKGMETVQERKCGWRTYLQNTKFTAFKVWHLWQTICHNQGATSTSPMWNLWERCSQGLHGNQPRDWCSGAYKWNRKTDTESIWLPWSTLYMSYV